MLSTSSYLRTYEWSMYITYNLLKKASVIVVITIFPPFSFVVHIEFIIWDKDKDGVCSDVIRAPKMLWYAVPVLSSLRLLIKAWNWEETRDTQIGFLCSSFHHYYYIYHLICHHHHHHQRNDESSSFLIGLYQKCIFPKWVNE